VTFGADYDAIVLGGGAAGLMCAAVAGQRGRRVLLIDHADQVGKKILISGGGRCNFTNIHTAPDRYLSANPHFAKSALGRYAPQDFIDLVDRHGIAWHEKTLGQLFCDGSAKQIVAMLVEECAKGSSGNCVRHGGRRDRASRRALSCGGSLGAGPGDRNRWAVHPEDGGDRLRL
jgi:predicted flavoprotein YhiN